MHPTPRRRRRHEDGRLSSPGPTRPGHRRCGAQGRRAALDPAAPAQVAFARGEAACRARAPTAGGACASAQRRRAAPGWERTGSVPECCVWPRDHLLSSRYLLREANSGRRPPWGAPAGCPKGGRPRPIAAVGVGSGGLRWKSCGDDTPAATRKRARAAARSARARRRHRGLRSAGYRSDARGCALGSDPEQALGPNADMLGTRIHALWPELDGTPKARVAERHTPDECQSSSLDSFLVAGLHAKCIPRFGAPSTCRGCMHEMCVCVPPVHDRRACRSARPKRARLTPLPVVARWASNRPKRASARFAHVYTSCVPGCRCRVMAAAESPPGVPGVAKGQCRRSTTAAPKTLF